MRWKKISDAVVRRLPLYLRVLEEAGRDGKDLMSSQELGQRAGVSPALVRKDLAWFGEFGKQGVGYEIDFLKQELRRILNLHREIPIALVGVGRLGQALAHYFQGRRERDPDFNLRVAALFDADERKFGQRIGDLLVYPIDELTWRVREQRIRMAIIAVPAAEAQRVADALVQADIRGLLNFAPVKLAVPEGVRLANADVSLELQRLAYYISD